MATWTGWMLRDDERVHLSWTRCLGQVLVFSQVELLSEQRRVKDSRLKTPGVQTGKSRSFKPSTHYHTFRERIHRSAELLQLWEQNDRHEWMRGAVEIERARNRMRRGSAKCTIINGDHIILHNSPCHVNICTRVVSSGESKSSCSALISSDRVCVLWQNDPQQRL